MRSFHILDNSTLTYAEKYAGATFALVIDYTRCSAYMYANQAIKSRIFVRIGVVEGRRVVQYSNTRWVQLKHFEFLFGVSVQQYFGHVATLRQEIKNFNPDGET